MTEPTNTTAPTTPAPLTNELGDPWEPPLTGLALTLAAGAARFVVVYVRPGGEYGYAPLFYAAGSAAASAGLFAFLKVRRSRQPSG
ncbi:MAG: hypothetical protein AAF907_03265 [Planctomycetota bacterium]